MASQNDALKLAIRAGLKERRGVSGKFLAEQKMVLTRDKLFQLGPSLQQRTLSEVLAIKVQKVEGAED